mgnify:FL=1|jgi:hypothetical protein
MRIIYAFFFRVATLTDYADTYGAHGFLKLYMDQKKGYPHHLIKMSWVACQGLVFNFPSKASDTSLYAASRSFHVVPYQKVSTSPAYSQA